MRTVAVIEGFAVGPKIKDVLDRCVAFQEIEGTHDDYLFNPGPYIELLLKEL